MKVDWVKLIESLKYIKEICKNHECSGCPIVRTNGCGIHVTDPAFWPLREKAEVFYD